MAQKHKNAFCRTPAPSSDAEGVKRIKKHVDADNYHAVNNIGGYIEGELMVCHKVFTKAS